jgi:hypothetical protein
MKKNIMLALVMISILTLMVSVAATPLAKKTVSIWGVQYNASGLMVRFTVAGFDRRSNLQGSIMVDKLSTPLKCKYDGVRTVTCVAKNMNKYDGLNARIWFAGSVFYTQLPFLATK